MLELPYFTKIVLVLAVVSFSALGILMYLPQMGTVSSNVLTSGGVMFGIGMVGLTMCLISPIFFIESFYSHDYLEGFEYGFLLALVGFVLIIAWIW